MVNSAIVMENIRRKRGEGTTNRQLENTVTSKAADQEEDEDFELEEDAYSILFVARNFSSGQVVAIGVMMVQLLILFLIQLDVLDDDLRREGEDDKNRFNVPIAVEKQVSVAQVLALIIAVITQENALVSLDALFLADYDPACTISFPDATLLKWKAVNIMRWGVGVFTLFVSFLIVNQSSDVLDIFMNFAAVQFVDGLDNAAFQLAAGGYFGSRLQENTKAVHVILFSRDRHPWRMLATQFSFAATLGLLIVGWTAIRIDQKKGRFVAAQACDSVFVRFGNEHFDGNPTHPLYYANFGGRYHARFDSDKRPIYYERSATDVTPRTARFYYCDDEKSWHYTVPELQDVIPEGTKKYCKEGWLMQSPVTEAYMLEDVGTKGWKLMVNDGTLEHNVEFTMRCGSCSRDSDCSFNGDCIGGECHCDQEWQGFECNVKSPFCPGLLRIAYDESASLYSERNMYHLITDETGTAIKAYGRPMYVLGEWDEDGCGMVVLYGGNRWYEVRYCRNQLSNSFHVHWNPSPGGGAFSFSEETESNSPINLQWSTAEDNYATGTYGAFGAYNDLINTRYECRDVSCDPMACGSQGECVFVQNGEGGGEHRCQCSDYSGGYFCQYYNRSPYSYKEYDEFHALITSLGYPDRASFEELDAGVLTAIENSDLSVNIVYYKRYWRPFLSQELTGNRTVFNETEH